MAGPSGKRFAWTWSNYMGWTWSKAGAFRTRIWYHHCDLPGRGTPVLLAAPQDSEEMAMTLTVGGKKNLKQHIYSC